MKHVSGVMEIFYMLIMAVVLWYIHLKITIGLLCLLFKYRSVLKRNFVSFPLEWLIY